MLHKRASLALASLILLLSGWAVLSALHWPWKAKLFPLVIGIPLFCLALAEVLWELFGSSTGSAAADFKLSSDVPPELARRRTCLAASWIGGFFILILLVGFPVAVPVLVFCYVKLQGRKGWLFAGAFAAAVSALFYALFDQLLHLPFPDGWIFAWLGFG